jgi:hypothetical protein
LPIHQLFGGQSLVDNAGMWRFAVMLVLASGCGDECRDGESVCDGNRPMACAHPDDASDGPLDFRLQEERCDPDSCLDTEQNGLRVAVCSTSRAPDPRCGGTDYASFCYDIATKLVCAGGYSQERDCIGSCITTTTVTGGSRAFCGTETAPSSACHERPTCDGASVISCDTGYVVDRIACSGTCLTSAAGVPYCSDGTVCTGDDEALCDGLTALHGCISGLTVAMTCNALSECENYGIPPEFTTTEAECTARGY